MLCADLIFFESLKKCVKCIILCKFFKTIHFEKLNLFLKVQNCFPDAQKAFLKFFSPYTSTPPLRFSLNFQRNLHKAS